MSWNEASREPAPVLLSPSVVSGSEGAPNWVTVYDEGGWLLELGCEDGDGETGRFAPMRVTTPVDAFLTAAQRPIERVLGVRPTIIVRPPGGAFLDMLLFADDGTEALSIFGQTFAPALDVWDSPDTCSFYGQVVLAR